MAIFECYSEHEASASRTAFLSERFALSLAYQSLTWDKEKGVYEEISKDEWMRCKKHFGFREISDKVAYAAFDSLDDDKSGELEYKELNKMLRKGYGSEVQAKLSRAIDVRSDSRAAKMTRKMNGSPPVRLSLPSPAIGHNNILV